MRKISTATIVAFSFFLIFTLCGCTSSVGKTSDGSAASQQESANTALDQTDSAGTSSSENANASESTNANASNNTGSSANSENSNQSTDSYSGQSAAQIQVSISIDTSAAHEYASQWPNSLGSFTVTLNENATVYDALKATGVRVGGTKSYVASIGGLGEKVCGAQSGWKYSVNGATPSAACNAYKLKNGDSVCWYYTLSS